VNQRTLRVLRGADNPDHDVIGLMEAVKEMKRVERQEFEERMKLQEYLRAKQAQTPEGPGKRDE
jgi:hypothetical protein